MTTRVILEPVFILHGRPYRNTSLIVEMFTMRYGRVAALARSARGLSSRYKGKLQPFSPMLASWTGRSELMNLGQVELNGMAYQIEGQALLCAFYLNELIMRLLQRDDPYPILFEQYQATLNALEKKASLEKTLRCFEKNLLERLGYGLSLERDAQTGEDIQSDQLYQYIPERGFLRCDVVMEGLAIFSGKSLLSLREEKFCDKKCLQDAKRLMRIILSHHLGPKPLKSRELLL